MAHPAQETAVALMIDCDNVPPAIAEFALERAAQAGRVKIRRGYGTANSLKNWEQVLVQQSFTTFLLLPHASKKNTTDIALALDALELLLDNRAQAFCLVTGDSDFAQLCRKLRERGATVYVIGDARSPPALRNACDQFFEWVPAVQPVAKSAEAAKPKATPAPQVNKPAAKKAAAKGPRPKQSPAFVLDAVAVLAAEAPNGRVTLEALGLRLKRDRPAFKPNTYGHAKLLTMLKTYSTLELEKDASDHWAIRVSRPR